MRHLAYSYDWWKPGFNIQPCEAVGTDGENKAAHPAHYLIINVRREFIFLDTRLWVLAARFAACKADAASTPSMPMASSSFLAGLLHGCLRISIWI